MLSKEERIKQLDEKRAEIIARGQDTMEKIQKKKDLLLNRGAVRQAEKARRQQMERAMRTVAPGWSEPHWIAAVEAIRKMSDSQIIVEDMTALRARGEALMEMFGEPKRGRPSLKPGEAGKMRRCYTEKDVRSAFFVWLPKLKWCEWAKSDRSANKYAIDMTEQYEGKLQAGERLSNDEVPLWESGAYLLDHHLMDLDVLLRIMNSKACIV